MSATVIEIERKLEMDSQVHDGLAILPFEQARPLWDTAMTRFPGATLYHRETWLRALRRTYAMGLVVAALSESGAVRAAALFARSRTVFGNRLVALPFSDSCQPLARDAEAGGELMRRLAESRAARSMEVRGASGPAPWRNYEYFVHFQVDLQRPFAEIQKNFGRHLRNKAKRARREGILIDRGSGRDYMERFYQLQLITRRRLGVPPQPFRFFDAVHGEFAPAGNCEIWFARHEGRDLAGLVLLRDGDELYYKWGARTDDGPPGANHLLTACLVEEFAQKAKSLDLGRCDSRNAGLVSFKGDLTGVSRPLPYAFYPAVPHTVSSEVLTGPAKLVSTAWKRLPLPLTRLAGETLYRFLG